MCLFWDSGEVGEKVAYLDSWNDHHQFDLKFKRIKIKALPIVGKSAQSSWRENS